MIGVWYLISPYVSYIFLCKLQGTPHMRMHTRKVGEREHTLKKLASWSEREHAVMTT